MVEYNPNFNYDESVSLKYQADYVFQYNWAHSASIKAFEKLAEAKGYFLYHEITKSDLIFVRNDLADKVQPLNPEYLETVRKRPAHSFWAQYGDPVTIRAQFVDV